MMCWTRIYTSLLITIYDCSKPANNRNSTNPILKLKILEAAIEKFIILVLSSGKSLK